jgi:hypothetical protein
MAELSGAAPVALIPTFCAWEKEIKVRVKAKSVKSFFIGFD